MRFALSRADGGGFRLHDFVEGSNTLLTDADAAIMQALIERYPEPITLNDLATVAGRQPNGVKMAIHKLNRRAGKVVEYLYHQGYRLQQEDTVGGN